MGKVFYIIGKSASGKDSVYKSLLSHYWDMREIKMYTTRPMREGEVNGKEYIFISDEELDNYINEGKVFEVRTYETVNGLWCYGTLMDESFDIKNNNYLGIGTLESFKNLRYKLKGNIVPIMIDISDSVRLKRSISREDGQLNPDYNEICRRFLSDSRDFSEDKLKDIDNLVRINNEGSLEDTVRAVCEVIDSLKE